MPTYSTDTYVGKFFKSYDECMNYEPTCLDVKRVSDIFKMPKEEIDEIRYVLSNPLHREMYDKSETFVRKKTVKKAPTEGARYMDAYKELGSFVIFMVLTFMIVQQHQNFAKQTTIGSLLLFSYLIVQLKMPKEAMQEENIVIQAANAIPYVKDFTYFEIVYMLKSVLYPSIFQLVLRISSQVDVEPTAKFKEGLLLT